MAVVGSAFIAYLMKLGSSARSHCYEQALRYSLKSRKKNGSEHILGEAGHQRLHFHREVNRNHFSFTKSLNFVMFNFEITS